MGSLKKFDGSSWINSNLRKLTTDTDTFTTFPAIIYAGGTNATVGLKGNTVQSGTPTPDSPVMPQGTGERTGNLFDYSTITTGYRIVWTTGDLYADATGIISDFIEVAEGQRYQISDSTKPLTAIIIGYNQNKEYLGAYNLYNGFIKAPSNRYDTITVPQNSGCKYVKLMSFTENPIGGTSMFTAGTTAPSEFIPYGYKIPISSANTTTPVYLGEVETTRRIKKLVLNGTENWRSTSGRMYLDALSDDYMRASGVITCICTHYSAQEQVGSASRVNGGCITLGLDSSNQRLYVYDTNISTAADFKTYLQQQYSAGTPVTVWYVLATEETGIVNEPLMRIGDYTDTLSGISIPVTAGGDALSVGTTVQPSEVTANYYGWHTITVHERESGQWD